MEKEKEDETSPRGVLEAGVKDLDSESEQQASESNASGSRRGGFAEVYQGCLEEGKLIAVKKLTNGSIEEKTAGFLSELGVIAHVDHPNTAKIIGCCVERDMHLLVFSLSPLGSLGSLLHGPNKHKLDWSKRYKIALGIADGLLYLHENCHRRIIHRDIKAENILLTENFDPQANKDPKHC
ncbi:Receptor-like cytosolic serine/threonine-protein kinase [Arachis hypogaea]|uniref:non-specific serine/threonine protein kinase n=1 Tax=Arachis hypogaea TaxID=3818 RepID=A0A6B9V925_ARAHY|nr:Receptor-like cytosolic serine/threonine-protein kinase [Arachis hypogaea]